MFRTGHYGVALIVWSPVGAALIVAGLSELAIVGAGVVLGLTSLPDVDHRIPLIAHRGVTHTLPFALLVGGLLGTAGWHLGSTEMMAGIELAGAAGSAPGTAAGLAAFGFLAGALAIVAHLLADMLTPAGVRLLWPVSSRTYTLGLVRASNVLANYGLLVLGVATAAVALVGATRIAG